MTGKVSEEEEGHGHRPGDEHPVRFLGTCRCTVTVMREERVHGKDRRIGCESRGGGVESLGQLELWVRIACKARSADWSCERGAPGPCPSFPDTDRAAGAHGATVGAYDVGVVVDVMGQG
jgi:hypothetical protein